MSISVNSSTNSAALSALQDLNSTQNQLTQVENIISSTQKVSSAQDNPAVWSVAQTQNQQISGLQAVSMSLSRASSIADMATSAGQQVISLLNQLKQDALSATEPSLDASSRQAYTSDFQNTLNTISQTISNASFDNTNLIDGSQASNLSVLASPDGSASVTLSLQNLSVGGPLISVNSSASLSTTTLAAAALAEVDGSLSSVTSALANLGAQSSQLSSRASFVTQMSDSDAAGVGTLVNADMGAESARLQALQIQQQLSTQALSIANQAPSVILSLFR
jgi:flagellin